MHPTMRDSEDLAAARKAWKDKARAESQLTRLRGYKRMTPGMKDDYKHWSEVARQADYTLLRILGGG